MINGIYTAEGGPGPIGKNLNIFLKFYYYVIGAPTTPATTTTTVPGAVPSAPPAPQHQATGNKATPISMLQELCQKLNKQPRYDLLTMEGRAHQPSFVFR